MSLFKAAIIHIFISTVVEMTVFNDSAVPHRFMKHFSVHCFVFLRSHQHPDVTENSCCGCSNIQISHRECVKVIIMHAIKFCGNLGTAFYWPVWFNMQQKQYTENLTTGAA